MNVAVIRIATMTLAAMVVISKMLLGVSDLDRPTQDGGLQRILRPV
jgi:hypothetical protein